MDKKMSETQAPYDFERSHTGGSLRLTVAVAEPQDDLTLLLAEMKRGLLMVIRALEKYEEARLTSSNRR